MEVERGKKLLEIEPLKKARPCQEEAHCLVDARAQALSVRASFCHRLVLQASRVPGAAFRLRFLFWALVFAAASCCPRVVSPPPFEQQVVLEYVRAQKKLLFISAVV